MNKLTKVGCSALCGSLAAISAANAGDLTVTGGADMTWISEGGNTQGNPMGVGSNFSMLGSSELDNGWKVDLTIAHANGGAYSSAVVNLDMGMLGKVNFNSGDSGNGLQAIDDKMPTAWEEPWGAGMSTGIRLVDGVGASHNIQYTTPTIFGVTLVGAVAKDMGITDTADKATAADENEAGRGYDATININPSLGTEILSGLNIFAGAHYTDIAGNSATTENDSMEAAGGVTYDLGPISLGTQWSAEYTGENSSRTEHNSYKNHAFGMAFNINDNLSISYGEHYSMKAGYNSVEARACQDEACRRVEVSSTQVAYTMGGASVRVADINADNIGFSGGANRSSTVISLGLAF
jgi:hypothetical protein